MFEYVVSFFSFKTSWHLLIWEEITAFGGFIVQDASLLLCTLFENLKTDMSQSHGNCTLVAINCVKYTLTLGKFPSDLINDKQRMFLSYF